jgi:hypothetical protein
VRLFPAHICLGPSHICTGTGLTPSTSAPGLGSPLPHLLWDQRAAGTRSTWAKASASTTATRCSSSPARTRLQRGCRR